MNFLKRNILLFVIFITGGAVLIIEITAFRILAPYFGNTLYSTSSIIGVVLGALSLGYYIGGILADKYPSRTLFFSLILIAGIFSLLIQVLAKTVLFLFGYKLNIVIGPPIISMALFFIPSLILGMMSPFAIKLKSLESKEIGRISGSVFFWSTLGSIFGSFAAGFILIPNFGVNTIILFTGATLVIIGGLGSLKFLFRNNPAFFFFSFFLSSFIIFELIFILSWNIPSPNILYERDGLYNRIRVYEAKLENRDARILTLDRYMHGAVFLTEPEAILNPFDYYITYKLVNSQAKNFLIIGGGAYIVPRHILWDSPSFLQRLDVVEIEPELFSLAKKYFFLPDDSRLSNYVADGRRFLASRTEESYDVIFGDAYSSISIPVHLVTKEFFELVSKKLTPQGVFIGNFIGDLSEGRDDLLLSQIRTFRTVFPNSFFFATKSQEFEGPQNFIFLGIKDPRYKLDFGSSEILESEYETIRGLPQRLLDIDNFALDSAYLLTDNFAPVEYLTARALTGTH